MIKSAVPILTDAHSIQLLALISWDIPHGRPETPFTFRAR